MACCTAWQRGIRRHFDAAVYNTSVAARGTSDDREILYMKLKIHFFVVIKVRATQIMFEHTRLFLPVSALVVWVSPEVNHVINFIKVGLRLFINTSNVTDTIQNIFESFEIRNIGRVGENDNCSCDKEAWVSLLHFGWRLTT